MTGLVEKSSIEARIGARRWTISDSAKVVGSKSCCTISAKRKSLNQSVVGRFQIQQKVQRRRTSSNCGCKEKAKYSKVQQVFKGTSNYANVQIWRRYANVQQDALGSTNLLM